MSSEYPPHLRLIPMDWHGPVRVAVDERGARRDASLWYVRLREEDGEEAAKAEFDEWLHAHPLHAEAWGSMCETMAAVGRAPSELHSYALPGRTHSRTRLRRTPATGQRRPRARVAVAALAAAAAFALAIPSVSLRLRADHVTSAGHVEQFRLADGSALHLGPDSAVAIDYDDGKRTVRLLAGQAMFDVTPDPNRPFRVSAGNVTTTVLGTSFDVRMIGGTTSISVSHGHVRVEGKGTSPVARRELRAGDWVRIAADQSIETGKIAPLLVGSWNRGEVLAENRSIVSVIDEIRPWYGGKIVVIDTDLASRPVTGIYSLRDPAQALSMIVKPYGGRVTRITPWLLVVNGS